MDRNDVWDIGMLRRNGVGIDFIDPMSRYIGGKEDVAFRNILQPTAPVRQKRMVRVKIGRKYGGMVKTFVEEKK